MTVSIPAPRFSMIEIKRDGLPSTITINEALADFAHRDAFMWLLLIELTAPQFDDDGLPLRDSARRLFDQERRALDLLSSARTHEGTRNGVYVASVASAGRRTTYLYVRDPFVATNALEALTRADVIEWTYDSKLDRGWTKVAFAFELLHGACKSRYAEDVRR